MSEESNEGSAALGIDDETPELYALVELTSLEAIAFVKRAPLEQVLLWGVIFGMDGRQTKRLDQITSLEQLQYLYWNTTQTAPSDSLETLTAQCAELAINLPEDTTSVEDLRSQIPPELLKSLGQNKGASEMGQGGKEVSPKGGKKGKAAAAAGAEGGEAAKEVKEAKPKKEKDPNGRPGEGTSTRKVWDIADELAKKNNDVTPTRAAVIEAATAAGVNKATAGVQYGAWFKGMKRTPAPAPPKEEKVAEGGAAAGETAAE